MRIFLLTLFGLSGLWLGAQIEGQVLAINEQGKAEPLPGANVFWKGSQTGTVTDSAGYYRLERSPGHSTLAVSFLGFEAQEKVIISRKGTVNFTLKPAGQELEAAEVKGQARATQIDHSLAQTSYRMDDQELRKAACCNLSESFETNASVDMTFTDAVTGTQQIEMLGLAGKYALIQRENIPYVRGLNASRGMSYLPGPFLESIQLTKGLSSVLNGFESISGQINAELIKPENADPLLVNLFFNQGGRSEMNVGFASKFSEEVKNYTMLHGSIIPFAQDRNNDGFADITMSEHANLNHRTHWRDGNRWEGQIGVNAVIDERTGGTLDFIENGNPTENWGYQSSNERLEVFGKTGYLFAEEYRSIGLIYSYNWQQQDERFGQRSYTGEQNSAYFNAIYQDILGNTNHRYKTGLSLQYDQINQSLDSADEFNLAAQQRREAVPGAFFEYSWEASPRMLLVAGLRVDYNDYFEQFYLTPRLHLRYDLSDQTTIRIGGGRGQRTPNLIAEHSYALSSSRRMAFPELRPEIAWNAGMSISQTIALGNRVLNLNVDGFYTWFESKTFLDLDQSPLEALVLSREGSRSLSLMGQVDYEWFKGFETRLAYKYLQAQDPFTIGLAQVYRTPEHRGFFNLNYAFAKKWRWDATFNWYGQQRLPETDLSPGAFQQPDQSPAYSTVNSQINFETGRWEFYLGVNNLFDFRQEAPIVNAEQPFDPYFDANFTWGPVFGRMFYSGLYFRLE